MSDPGPVSEAPDGAALRIRVTPKARRPGVLGVRGDAVAVAVTAAAERGRATEEALDRVAAWLGVKRSAVRLRAGATSRDKRVIVTGISASDLRKRVELAAGAAGREGG